jgi:D-glycero-D-manno-heptose 1,7-bisphosphate phosphatase
VKRTNDALLAMLAKEGLTFASVQVCTHHPDGGPGGDTSLVGPCDCRKPKPGMMNAIARELGLDAARTWMVGDSAADVEAGAAAGMKTGLVFPNNRCELCPLRAGLGGVAVVRLRAVPDVHASTLSGVARAIVAAS